MEASEENHNSVPAQGRRLGNPCVGLKKTVSHGLGYLDTWFPVGRAIWEGLSDTAVLEEYISGADLDLIQLTLFPIHSLICASN